MSISSHAHRLIGISAPNIPPIVPKRQLRSWRKPIAILSSVYISISSNRVVHQLPRLMTLPATITDAFCIVLAMSSSRGLYSVGIAFSFEFEGTRVAMSSSRGPSTASCHPVVAPTAGASYSDNERCS